MGALRLPFPTGEVIVEIVPEASRMNINTARPEDLMRLMQVLGLPPERAQAIVAGIVDWRTPMPPGQVGPFDSLYLSRTPSFRARHASFEEIEELMLVAGVTTELFHRAYERDQEGRLWPRSGLKRCLSVWGANDRFDVLGAEPAVLMAAGAPPDVAAALVRVRQENPMVFVAQPAVLNQIAGPAAGRLRIGGNSIYTLRATATLRLPDGRLSDVRRSVAATVKFNLPDQNPPIETLRWYENAGM
jgi:general secretion pathway protein K